MYEFQGLERDNNYNKKIICRYGRGCTHIYDAIHRERFWHPPCPIHTDEQLRKYFICNECGAASLTLQELQLHLKRKTAWSNVSLLGCRISCLVDNKEWHEGFVTQYHKSGKHLVEFRQFGEKRWLLMKKIAFYIVERPERANIGSSEYKENDATAILGDGDGLAPDENWVFAEDISTDYAFAQSVLFKLHGRTVQETGHKTKGHICLTKDDRESSKVGKGSLLYGELLPRGANRAFGAQRLNAANASVLFDLGMGTGKICCQAFLQYRNLQYVYGVELSQGRYAIAADSALQMVTLLGADLFEVQSKPGEFIMIREKKEENGKIVLGRTMHFECGSLFDVENIEIADIIMLETDITPELFPNLCDLLSRLHPNARTLTYLDLRKIWCSDGFSFKQLEANCPVSDRYPTSWSVQRGHHFYLWIKLKEEEISKASKTTANDPRGRQSSDSNADFYDYVSTSKCVPINFLKILRNRWKLHWKSGKGKATSRESHEGNNDRIIPLNVIHNYEQNTNEINNQLNTNQENNENSLEIDKSQPVSIRSNGYNKKHLSKKLKSGNGNYHAQNDGYQSSNIETVKEESQSYDSKKLNETEGNSSNGNDSKGDNSGEIKRNAIEVVIAKIISKALSDQSEYQSSTQDFSVEVESIEQPNCYAEQMVQQGNNRLNNNPISSNGTVLQQSPLALSTTADFIYTETINTPQYLKTQYKNDIQRGNPFSVNDNNNADDDTSNFYFNSVRDLPANDSFYGDSNDNGGIEKIFKDKESTIIDNNKSKNSDDVCVVS